MLLRSWLHAHSRLHSFCSPSLPIVWSSNENFCDVRPLFYLNLKRCLVAVGFLVSVLVEPTHTSCNKVFRKPGVSRVGVAVHLILLLVSSLPLLDALSGQGLSLPAELFHRLGFELVATTKLAWR